MLDKLIKFLGDVPEHIWAFALIALGALIAITHAAHGFEVGTSLTSAGLAAYKGKQS
jgi:hypothetical protein